MVVRVAYPMEDVQYFASTLTVRLASSRSLIWVYHLELNLRRRQWDPIVQNFEKEDFHVVEELSFSGM